MPRHCLNITVGPLTQPAQGYPPHLACRKGRASVRSPSRKDRNQRAGPSRSWWASHSLSPNGHRPWLPGPCVFGGPSSVGSTGAHGQRQSFGIGKGLPSAPKGFWLPAASHLCIPMVPTGGMGNLRLGEVPLPWDQGPGGWEGWKGMTKACLWTPHTKPSPSTCGPTADG